METLQKCNALLYPDREVIPFVLPFPHQQCDCVKQNEWAAGQVKNSTPRGACTMVVKPDIPAALVDHQRLTRKYPRVRWLLLHNARSYSAWAIEKAVPALRDLPNLWFESSSVCEADSFFVTFSKLSANRFCYGSDDIPVGITRGKYIAWGYGWEQLDGNNFTAKPKHCDGRMTFGRYEMLRAIRRAAQYAGLSRSQIEGIFYGNGNRLVTEARADLEKARR